MTKKLIVILVDSKEKYNQITKIIGHNVHFAREATIGYYMEFIVNNEEIDKLRGEKIPFSLSDRSV